MAIDMSNVHQALDGIETAVAGIAGVDAERVERLHAFLGRVHDEVDAIAAALENKVEA